MSPREAYLEYRISQGGPALGLAALAAYRRGGSFADFIGVLSESGPECDPIWSRPDTPDEAWAYQPGGRKKAFPRAT